MATVTETRPATKPITVAPPTLTPWDENAGSWIDPNALPFGTRVTLADHSGVHRVVRAAEMGNDGHFRVRVRELADDGSMFGPVRSVQPREVAAIVTAEPKAEPAGIKYDNVILDSPAPAAAVDRYDNVIPVHPTPPADAPRPLVVALAISIDGTHYAVAPLAPAPDAVKAYRFCKVGGDEAVYDLDETATGASCSCPDFVFRHDGLDSLGCKHLRAARMMGLLAEAPEPTTRTTPPDEFDEPDPRDAYNDHREKLARIAAAEDAVRREGEARHVEADCCPAGEPMPCTACVQAPAPLPGPDDEPTPDDVEEHDGPGDMSDDGWDDAHIWSTSDVAPDPDDAPEPRSLAEQVDDHARELRAVGSPLHDLLAERAEQLAEQIRFLEASTVEQYRDRLDAHLDCVQAEAEARMAARCG